MLKQSRRAFQSAASTPCWVKFSRAPCRPSLRRLPPSSTHLALLMRKGRGKRVHFLHHSHAFWLNIMEGSSGCNSLPHFPSACFPPVFHRQAALLLASARLSSSPVAESPVFPSSSSFHGSLPLLRALIPGFPSIQSPCFSGPSHTRPSFLLLPSSSCSRSPVLLSHSKTFTGVSFAASAPSPDEFFGTNERNSESNWTIRIDLDGIVALSAPGSFSMMKNVSAQVFLQGGRGALLLSLFGLPY